MEGYIEKYYERRGKPVEADVSSSARDTDASINLM
jgi:hypothetical protein